MLPAAAIAYFVLALVASWTSAVLTPPFQVPDEAAHYFFSYGVSTGQLSAHPLPAGGAGMSLPKGAVDLAQAFTDLPFHPGQKATAEIFARAAAAGSTVPTDADLTTSALYPPVAYLVQGAALAAARAAGLGLLQAFYVGRLASALVFVLVTTLAIALLPTARLALAALLLLPMVSAEAGSYSADGFVIAGSALLCALIARWSLTGPPRGGLVGATLLAVLLAATKLPMVALALPLAVLASRGSLVRGIALVAIVAGAVVAWVLLFSAMHSYMALELPGPLAHRSVLGQLLGIVQHPLDFAATVGRTLGERNSWYLQSAVGILGWLDAPLPAWFYPAAYLAAAGAALSALTSLAGAGPGIRPALLLAGLGGIVLVFIVLYLAWTGVGGPYIEGVQGRYLLPFLAALVLGLSGWLRAPAPVARTLGIAALALWPASFFAMTMTLLGRYYIG